MSRTITWRKDLREYADEHGRTMWAFGINGPQTGEIVLHGAVPREVAAEMLEAVQGIYAAWRDGKRSKAPKTSKKKSRAS